MEAETMNYHKFRRIIFTTLGFFLLAAEAKAQCLRGLQFAYCPAADTLYVLTETSLGAWNVSERKVKWQIKLPKGVVISNLVATADRVAFAAEQYPSTIHAYDALTGKASWQVERNRIETMGSQGPYIFAETDELEGLIAIDCRTGKIAWTHEGKKRGFANIEASSDGILLTSLFAIDAYSGRVLKRWPKDWDVSVAMFAGDLRIIGTEHAWSQHVTLAVYSGPAFKLLWARSDPKNPIVAGIAAEGDKMLVATYEEEHMFRPGRAALEMMSARTGKTIWTKEITSDYMLLPTPVTLTQGTAIFFMDDTPDSSVMQAFDANTGIQKWIVHTDRRLTDGVCSGQSCYFGAVSNTILEVDAQSGAVSWLSLPKQ
jgi:outer membrane protein assembly factor BamB